MNCPKCNSTKVTVQAVAEQKKRGILGVCLWLILGFFTCGVALLFPLFIKKGSKQNNTPYVKNAVTVGK